MTKMEGYAEAEAWTGGAQMLGVGWHSVRIEDAEDGTSSGGHPQVEIRYANPNGDIRDWIVFAPAKVPGEVPFAVRKAKGLLEVLEVTAEKDEFPTAAIVGKALDIYVGQEQDFNDPTKLRKRVQGYAPEGMKSASDLPADGVGFDGQQADPDDIPF